MIDRTDESELLRKLKAKLPDLEALLEESSSHWADRDLRSNVNPIGHRSSSGYVENDDKLDFPIPSDGPRPL